MSEGSSWKYLSSASSKVKGYISQQDFKGTLQRQIQTKDGGQPGWRQWAGQKIAASRRSTLPNAPGSEQIALFPGWAARRPAQASENTIEAPFDVDVYVSGFASLHRPPELASRSQRAFMRLARGFAALPKLTDESPSPTETMASVPLSRSTEELLARVKLPPPPSEISEDFELEALERHFQRQRQKNSDFDSGSDSDSVSGSEPEYPPTSNAQSVATVFGDPRKLHANFNARLRPFWASVLPNRAVRLHLFASPTHYCSPNTRHDSQDDRNAIAEGPVATQDVMTGTDGSFQVRFRLRWEDMCQHPGALHIAFGDPKQEHEILAAAQLLPLPGEEAMPFIMEKISLTHAKLRVISDIDDTVKHSNVGGGARAIFRNVFVKELKDLVLPGIGEWYTRMWKHGVRFHYVSNGPFELLPILGEFFRIANLPPGSLKLRSYAGRSLFNGLLSAPAARKRAGVLDILDSFPDSRFILIGDTGEQDLELYAELAYEKPQQISGIFIRRADEGEPLEDPTGDGILWDGIVVGAEPLLSATEDTPRPKKTSNELKTSREIAAMTPPYIPRVPRTPRSYRETSLDSTSSNISSGEFFFPHLVAEPDGKDPSKPSSSASSSRSFLARARGSMGPPPTYSTDWEKKQYDLQMRVYRARNIMPKNIPLRIFQSPQDCIEVDQILERYAESDST